MATVRWTLGARRDLQDAVSFIRKDSVVYAAAVALSIVSAVDRLELHPNLGRMVPEFNDETIRELIVGNYRIVYRIREPVVGIVAVIHGRRNLLAELANEPWDFP